MRKVAILTINDYNNYGNRLQNYALQETLKNLDVSVVTLVNNTNYYTFKNKMRNISDYTLQEGFKKIRSKIQPEKAENESDKARRDCFLNFTKEFIEEANFTISEKNLPYERLEEFDYFITGSDQVWNPHFRYGSFIDFLTFVPTEKRIAYAPSFGVDEIPKKFHRNYQKWLSGIVHLSVREQAGAEIIKSLTGKEVAVLADPTLLLTREQWLKASKEAVNRPTAPYLLTYFLGKPNQQTREKITQIAKENQLEIIHLGDRRERKTFETGPSEFIDYICSAQAFFTDSFHGVVFSLIFEKPFIVFERDSSAPSMHSRIETILKKYDLENREAKEFSGDVFSVDFSSNQKVFEAEYNQSIDFLKKALRIEG